MVVSWWRKRWLSVECREEIRRSRVLMRAVLTDIMLSIQALDSLV